METVARFLDPALGWILALPWSLSVVAVAVLTTLLMTVVRVWGVDQDRMGRCVRDLARLKERRRAAKRDKDAAALARHAAVQGRIKLIQTRYELRALAIGLGPALLLACWAYARLCHEPPRVGQVVELKATYPLSAVGRLTHLVAPAGVEVVGAPIREVKKDDASGRGAAVWTVRAVRPVAADLLVRQNEDSARLPVRLGGRATLPPSLTLERGGIESVELVLARPQFLGFVPHLDRIGFDSWIVAYIVLVLGLTPLCRRLLRIR